MSTYELDPLAVEDLSSYLGYVAADSGEQAALLQETRIHDALMLLATYPGLGRRPRIRGRPREEQCFNLPHTKLRAFYLERPEGGIYVTRIYHGARKPFGAG